jgi:tetratricopeptide (TPR) repeat protein
MAGAAEAVRRSPNDPNRIFDLAQNVFWLGELARFQGHTDQAFANYSEYKRLADQLVAIDPDNLKWRMESLYGREDVGIALFNKRRFAEAASEFASVVGPMERLTSVDPQNETYQTELSKVFAWLADAQRSIGNFDGAIDARRKQIALLNAAIAAGATNVEFRSQLIPAHQGLGILLTRRGDAEAGIVEFRAAVGQAHALLPVEPENMYWKTLAAGAELDLAKGLLSLGRRDEAARQTQSGCALVAAIRGRNPGSSKQTACLMMRSRLALLSGSTSQALALTRQALVSAQSERNEDPVTNRYGVAAAHLMAGDVYRRTGNIDAANEEWSKALASLPSGVAEKPSEMEQRAIILGRLGRIAGAKQIISKLDAMGYRRLT